MRIWYGNEMEGRDKGKPTIFIESALLADARKIISKIKHLPIKRIYFGAGRVDIIHLSPLFFRNFTDAGYEVIVESTCGNSLIPRFLENQISELVLRLDVKSAIKPAKLTFKTDDQQNAIIYRPDTITSLKAVKDGLYSNQDTILWEE